MFTLKDFEHTGTRMTRIIRTSAGRGGYPQIRVIHFQIYSRACHHACARRTTLPRWLTYERRVKLL
jgi:hypothetical protein